MSDPKLLLVETSGRRGRVGLARGEELLGKIQLEEGRRHARDLAPSISQLLQQADWKPNQLDAIVVSRGPGSYTGLRVGLISAMTLAYVIDRPILGIDTFSILAHQTPGSCQRVAVIADAQKQEIYVQSFHHENVGWQPTSSLLIESWSNWMSQRDPEAFVTGPGLTKWKGQLPDEVPCTEPVLWEPSVESLLALGLQRFLRQERDDLYSLEPLYLRSSSAEQQFGKQLS